MSISLHTSGSELSGVHPTLDENGQLTSLRVDIALSFSDDDGVFVASKTESFNAWDLMSDTQKANMQDIQNTLMGYIIATYFT
jgi:hypothetical protein